MSEGDILILFGMLSGIILASYHRADKRTPKPPDKPKRIAKILRWPNRS